MTEINTQALKKDFHQDIIDLYKRITKMVKYKPTRLMDFINKYGGYEAAVKYITTESNVQDFAVLWESERLDLSVEALITCEKYRPIFNEDVLAYCDRKLKEYSYAPNKIEEVKEPTGYFDEDENEEKIDIEEFLRQKELMMPKVVKKDFKIYKFAVGISKDDWKSILLNTKIVTASNLDFLLRIYSIGDEVGPAELSKEKGLSNNYPYREVMMALGKRIKTALKVEVPVGEDQKPLWWHLLFNGGFKDNSSFEWSLKTELREALDEMIAEGTITKVEVNSEKERVPIEEETPIKKEIPTMKKKDLDDGMTAFDRLFASIMADDEPKKDEKPVQEAAAHKENAAKVSSVAMSKVSDEKLVTKIEPDKVVGEEKPLKVMTSLEEVTKDLAEAIHGKAEDSKAETVKETLEETSKDYRETIKAACIDYYGAICDLCGFDYGYTYGEAFEKMIEVHNVHGVLGDEILLDTDPVKDLIPICCNCHQVIHSQNPPISVEKMREMIKA